MARKAPRKAAFTNAGQNSYGKRGADSIYYVRIRSSACRWSHAASQKTLFHGLQIAQDERLDGHLAQDVAARATRIREAAMEKLAAMAGINAA